MTTTTAPQQQEEGSTCLYRLELPASTVEALARHAKANERSLPGQARFVLRQWAEQQGAA